MNFDFAISRVDCTFAKQGQKTAGKTMKMQIRDDTMEHCGAILH